MGREKESGGKYARAHPDNYPRGVSAEIDETIRPRLLGAEVTKVKKRLQDSLHTLFPPLGAILQWLHPLELWQIPRLCCKTSHHSTSRWTLPLYPPLATRPLCSNARVKVLII